MSDNSTLGRLIKTLRQQRGWTLREMSQEVGIPLSTLAKVETDKLSLSYDKLQQFTSRLGMSMTEFLSQTDAPLMPAQMPIVTGRKSTTSDDNSVFVSTENYDYQYVCADLSERRMVPILVRIKTHNLEEFGEPVSHRGEEFVYVLKGSVEVHTQFYRPVLLQEGQGIYLDSTMHHAYLAKDCDEALVLAVCSGDDLTLADELISVAERDTRQIA